MLDRTFLNRDNSRAMMSKMADVWKPAMGINIKELDTGVFIFQFYHNEDMRWVLNGGPWSFDNAMLVMETIPLGVEPMKVSLWHLNIWIQIHDLPTGFMSEIVGKQLGNFFGEFLEYDPKNNSSIWRECMRLKIRLDVRKPLKRKKKITRKNGGDFIVNCKYERLGEFCFICGLISHTDRFCRRFLDKRSESAVKEWGVWLRVPPRRAVGQQKSKWLQEENDGEWETRMGRSNDIPPFPEKTKNQEPIWREGNFQNMDKEGEGADRAIIRVTECESNVYAGPDSAELEIMNIEERIRRRSEYELKEKSIMGDKIISNVLFEESVQEAGISGTDFPGSHGSVLATLARQASQSK